jgi:iron complex outermembrane receptor protein
MPVRIPKTRTPSPVRESQQDSYVSVNPLVARLTAQWKPTNQFTLTLKGAADRYRVTDATWNDELISCPTGSAQVHPGEICNKNWKIQQNDVPADIAATNPLLGRHGGKLYQDYDSYGLTANADYSTSLLDLSSVTGFHHFVNYFLGDYDFTGAANGGTWGAERSEYQAFSEEVRAQTHLSSPLNFMVGGYYQNTHLHFLQEIIFPGALEDPTAADPSQRYITVQKLSHTDGQTLAGFGQVIWKLTPQLEATLGARYTHETKDSVFDQPYVVTLYQGVFIQKSPLADNQTFDNLSPEATLTWRPTADLTVYGAYKKGFKSGGFSISGLHSAATTIADLAFRPEKPEGFEGGVKASLFNRSVRLALDAYDYRYRDFQIDYFDAVKITFVTKNANAESRGVEFQGEWAPEAVTGLTLNAALSYNQSTYYGTPAAPCWGGQRPSEGCSIVGGNARQSLNGKPTANAPKWTGALQADYQATIHNNLTFGVSGNMHASSSYLAGPFANPNALQSAFAVFDAAVRLGAENRRWELALIGKNLTNQYVSNAIGDAPSSGGGTGTPGGVHSDLVASPNPPRTVAVQFTLRY